MLREEMRVAKEREDHSTEGESLEVEGLEISLASNKIAMSLLSGKSKAVLLGNSAAQHPQASKLHATGQWIAQQTDAKFGYLIEAGNTVGGYLANAKPTLGIGRNAQQIFAKQHKAYRIADAAGTLPLAATRTESITYRGHPTNKSKRPSTGQADPA